MHGPLCMATWPPAPRAHELSLSVPPPSAVARVSCVLLCVHLPYDKESAMHFTRCFSSSRPRAHARGAHTHTQQHNQNAPTSSVGASHLRHAARWLPGSAGPRRGRRSRAAAHRPCANGARVEYMQSDMENSCVVALKAHSNTSTMTR